MNVDTLLGRQSIAEGVVQDVDRESAVVTFDPTCIEDAPQQGCGSGNCTCGKPPGPQPRQAVVVEDPSSVRVGEHVRVKRFEMRTGVTAAILFGPLAVAFAVSILVMRAVGNLLDYQRIADALGVITLVGGIAVGVWLLYAIRQRHPPRIMR